MKNKKNKECQVFLSNFFNGLNGKYRYNRLFSYKKNWVFKVNLFLKRVPPPINPSFICNNIPFRPKNKKIN